MNIESLINKNYEKLNENDRLICSYILNNKEECIKLSIGELAKRCNVSETTIFRFTKKISLKGFSELKIILKHKKAGKQEREDFLEEIVESYYKMIDDIGRENLRRLFEKIYMAENLIIYGEGYSKARVVSEFKRIFLQAKENIFGIYGLDMIESVFKISNENDLVVIISLEGEEENLLNLAKMLNSKGVETLSITKKNNNSLAGICKENLYINSIETPSSYNIKYEIFTPYFILIELIFLKYQNFLSVNKISKSEK